MRFGELGMSTDYEGRCGNCHEVLLNGDNYCRYCGTKRGEGAFAPYMVRFACIYGPLPVPRTHRCVRCGNSWTTEMMVDDQKFCPECGGDAPYTEERGFEWQRRR